MHMSGTSLLSDHATSHAPPPVSAPFPPGKAEAVEGVIRSVGSRLETKIPRALCLSRPPSRIDGACRPRTGVRHKVCMAVTNCKWQPSPAADGICNRRPADDVEAATACRHRKVEALPKRTCVRTDGAHCGVRTRSCSAARCLHLSAAAHIGVNAVLVSSR